MSASDKWDSRYRSSTDPGSAATALLEFQHLLPASGVALDLACGLGANALLLAKRGLTVHAWDSSGVALEKLNSFAVRDDKLIHTERRDVSLDPPVENRFDVIVVSHFLDRALCPAIAAALRPAGLLYYQTFTQKKVDPTGPSNPDYLLQENELLRLFPQLVLRAYREDSLLGDVDMRNQAYLVAEKRARITDGTSPQGASS
jgi:SAM-dependent methyltransferase|tara:strand:- start:192 stop:797 length:606 start_codon:yes stop_codon:yes gene_type:complete